MVAPIGPKGASELVEEQLVERLREVENLLNSDLVVYVGEITDTTPAVFKTILASIPVRRRKVTVLLETPGGYIEETERIANILRHNYRTVDFMVTTYAMSAGTVLVMSGDAILMDYSAVLGPIDPQIQREASSRFVPALGYLEQYDRMVKKSAKHELTSAELAFMVQNFDAAELYQFEQARDLSIALLEEWLVKYKFKNWRKTATTGSTVTAEMRRTRAREIGQALNDTSRWHSHSRGISAEMLRRQLRLHIDDIADVPHLTETVAHFQSLLYDYQMKSGHYYLVFACSGGYHGH